MFPEKCQSRSNSCESDYFSTETDISMCHKTRSLNKDCSEGIVMAGLLTNTVMSLNNET